MTTARRHRTGLLLAVLGLLAVGATGACSAGGGDSASDSAGSSDRGAVEAPAAPAKPGEEKAAPGGAGPADADLSQPDLKVDQRSIIYTGSLRVRVDDVDAAAADAIRIATTSGGFVGGDRRSGERIIGSGDNSGRSGAEADLVLRVPAAKFTTVVDQLAKLGEQLRREVNTEDVTEETVDLAARIATQRARVESGRKLLSQAKTLNELISLESEVAKREADLASLEAKQRRLTDLAALSTITVAFRQVVPPPAKEKKDEAGFLVGLKAGWNAFVGATVVVLTIVGALLPFLVLFGVPVVAVIWWLRRRRTGRPLPPAGPVPAGGPTGPVAPGPRQPVVTEPPSTSAPSAPGAGSRP